MLLKKNWLWSSGDWSSGDSGNPSAHQNENHSAIRLTHPLCGAFSLIELLVVVAIIAALAGMLIPAIGLVRDQAHQTRCISNLRQLGLGMLAYANDNEQCVPPTQCPAPDRDDLALPYWGMYWGFIEKYLPVQEGAPLYWCPNASFTLSEVRAMGWAAYGASYGMSDKPWTSGTKWYNYYLPIVPRHESSILMADKWGANNAGGPIANWSSGIGSPGLGTSGVVSGPRRPGIPSYEVRASHPGNRSLDPTKGRVGTLYFSGRAEPLRWQESYNPAGLLLAPNQWRAIY